MPLILADIHDAIGTLTLNYSLKRNALSAPLVRELEDALGRFESAGVRTVVLRAEPGARVWSAGHSVDELPDGRDPLGWRDPLRSLIRSIEAFPAPVIALVEGGVWGGACELVFACDVVVASPAATFAATPAKMGVPYNASGLLTFFNAAHLHIAKEMLFTASPVSAERLERLGIVNHVVAADEIDNFVGDMARRIAANAPLAIAVMKEELRILAGAHSLSPQDFERIQGLRRIVYTSEDYQEGVRAFKERRSPVFRGQ